MKNSIFTIAIISIFLTLFACSNVSSSPVVTKQGVAPILIGASTADLPAQVPGLYDAIETVHVDAWYDELEGEEVPGYDYLSFKLQGKEMLTANFAEDGKTIGAIKVKSPAITYKGIGPGMTITAALAAGAKLYIVNNYESCFFGAKLQSDGIGFEFEILNGGGFSDTGKSKLYQMSDYPEWTEIPFTATDFDPQATVDCISLY